MADLPRGLDPRETNGTSGETSKVGLYVFEPKDELDNKVGTAKFLEANDPAQADAFVHMGYRQASVKEVEAYVKQVEDARDKYREDLKKGEDLEDTLSMQREATLNALQDRAEDSKQALAGTVAEPAKADADSAEATKAGVQKKESK
jgi:hypothetical protein